LPYRIARRCLCWFPWLAGVMAVAGCAGVLPAGGGAWTDTLLALGFKPGEKVESIPRFRIDGFIVIDAQHVVLHTGADRSHVVTLKDECPALSDGDRIGYTTSAGDLTSFDKLFAIGRPQALPCRIESLQRLERVGPSR
jgi:hypothetical protein